MKNLSQVRDYSVLGLDFSKLAKIFCMGLRFFVIIVVYLR